MKGETKRGSRLRLLRDVIVFQVCPPVARASVTVPLARSSAPRTASSVIATLWCAS